MKSYTILKVLAWGIPFFLVVGYTTFFCALGSKDVDRGPRTYFNYVPFINLINNDTISSHLNYDTLGQIKSIQIVREPEHEILQKEESMVMSLRYLNEGQWIRDVLHKDYTSTADTIMYVAHTTHKGFSTYAYCFQDIKRTTCYHNIAMRDKARRIFESSN